MKTNTINPSKVYKTNENIKTPVKDGKDFKKNNKVPKASFAEVDYTPSKKAPLASAYNKKGHIYNKETIDKLKADAERANQKLINTVRAMVEKQGKKQQSIFDILGKDNLGKDKIDDTTKLQAKEMTSEDGEYGIKQTSQRIIEFAKAISGNDKSKYSILVSAIKKGFEAAKKALGGKLPEISQKTYDAVMEGLEAWQNEIKINKEN